MLFIARSFAKAKSTSEAFVLEQYPLIAVEGAEVAKLTLALSPLLVS